MDKKSRLKAELQLTEAGREFLEDVELPKHTNPLSPKVNGKVEPYKKVNTIIIPEGATNGDMIKIIFPDSELRETMDYLVHYTLDGYMGNCATKDWWNALYKKEVE